MPILNKNKLRTATRAADDDPGGGDGVDSSLRIVTLHDNCNGIVDLDRNEVDRRILCEAQDETVSIRSLDDLTYDVLDSEIGRIIAQSGDHGEAQTAAANIIILEYVYYDERIETEPLDGEDEQQLRSIIARGSGFLYVVWEWDNDDNN
ncbi:hypothetical protein LA080_011953 [Diaporthe eres]|uniref:Uncharacterized protein n=1 Tax=Diaporthe vaccinii TaxID=105482 RepID=A0ABR4DWA7_9PEZI|nr:hypothetical protein LA080_011953 [Diaporthe eres]